MGAGLARIGFWGYPPPDLPHKGGGVVSFTWHNLAKPTDRHLPHLWGRLGGGPEGSAKNKTARTRSGPRGQSRWRFALRGEGGAHFLLEAEGERGEVRIVLL